MYLSAGQAAKECGKSKGTISKALKSGRLSFVKKTSAGYEIDPAELFRVFPKETPQPSSANDQQPQQLTPDLAALNREIELLREMLEKSEETVERERSNADKWQKQAEILALTDDRAKGKGGLFGMFKKAG
jgi:hypothetical protein